MFTLPFRYKFFISKVGVTHRLINYFLTVENMAGAFLRKNKTGNEGQCQERANGFVRPNNAE
jgi:hypothetical protein